MRSDAVKIDVAKQDGAVLVTLVGEITTREDQHAVSELIAAKLGEGERLFVVDLSEVPFIGSVGIAVLVAAYVKVDREGGKLRLVNVRPRVARLLEMTKVADVFRTYSSVKEALESD